jgi:hypothetical protein
MTTRRLRDLSAVLAALSAGGLCALCAAAPPGQRAETVGTALPPRVAQLRSWASGSQEGERAVPADTSEWTVRARDNSASWVRKVLDARWLPEEEGPSLDAEIALLPGALGGLDISRVAWESEGYRFAVIQTRTIFYLEVRPPDGELGQGSVDAVREACREVAGALVSNTPQVERRLDGETVNVAPEGTRSLLLQKSFDAGAVVECKDGIVCTPAKVDVGDRLDLARKNFWWRRTGWWADERTLGLFALKTEGGAWRANYSDPLLDEHWLTPPPLPDAAK